MMTIDFKKDTVIKRTLKDMQDRIEEALGSDSPVVVYDQSTFEQLAEGELMGNNGFVAIMYAGMAPTNKDQHAVATIGRFLILVSFGGSKARIKGLTDPVDDITFMTYVRQALTATKAPNSQPYKFAGEYPTPFEAIGDGYTQQWNVPMSTKA